MTSATVTQLADAMTYLSSSSSGMDNKSGDFANVFQSATDKNDNQEIKIPEKTRTNATDQNVSASRTADKLRTREAQENTDASEKMDCVKEELKNSVESLKEKVAQKLNISVEELEQVMENLGIEGTALFLQDVMTSLVMEVEQITTSVELLTNGDAYQILQELNEVAKELLNEVQTNAEVTDKQMQDVLNQCAKVTEEPQIEPDMVSKPDETESFRKEETDETVKIQELQTEETLTEDNRIVSKQTENGHFEQKGDSEEHPANGQNLQTSANVSFTTAQNANQSNTEFSQTISEQRPDAQEIYNQIGEYVKSHVRPGITEVEMQLNPESLGSLHIHLSSKQGNVNAQLIVQNEAVKAALELQMIQLKENFVEQGMKVDVIEVTVESHAFHENMQQNRDESAGTEAEAKRRATRSIVLNDELAVEELTEEEQIVARMMAANGNTVDYMA